MPRYKYSCKECKLVDIKQFEYQYDHQTMRTLPVCPHCGTQLARDFLKPPRGWLAQQRRPL